MRNLNKSMRNANDERYTPPILVEPIVPFVQKHWTVWCPFDTDDSEFAIQLRRNGNQVIATHIWNGQDFFAYKPENYDCIISNPPFSRKLEVLARCYELDKPFAMLLNLECLNYQEVGTFFLNRPLQLLIPDKKVSFDGRTSSFNTSYFCNRLLPHDLMFAHLEHNNTGRNFVGSNMGR